jgi:rhodanese-related sulfurtransferase
MYARFAADSGALSAAPKPFQFAVSGAYNMAAELQEITPTELSRKLSSDSDFVIIDVRETWELDYAHIDDPRLAHVPMSEIKRLRQEAFPEKLRIPSTEIVVMCHHGVRSANVTLWMGQNGWKNVSSLAGGIDAYASEIDSSVGFY